MADHAARTHLATHEVTNQPLLGGDHDLLAEDIALRETLAREAPAWVATRLAPLAREAGRDTWQAIADEANRHPPELRLFDRHGRRLDEVHYTEAYHRLMHLACDGGWQAVAWEHEGNGGHQAHIAALYLLTQVEPGFCCPITMTHAAYPVLRHDSAILETWGPRLLANDYDPRALPADDKRAATFGMAMTEKQGGSDVRRNTTHATHQSDGSVRLTGHKWFCSAPMSDAFLTLAQDDAGLGCFLVPRFRPDGERNGIQLQRLKDKCGNRANASAEIEYAEAWAHPIGEPGRGVATILEMVQQTRLDAATAPAGMMRQATLEVWRHVQGREAFGKRLADQPLMQRVIADLALETEASLALCLRTARAFDGASRDPHEHALARLLPALAKFWHNKRGPAFMAEAMECLGGIGYVEEAPLARLYREAPVNSIWEGSGNVMCLDVMRVLARHPESIAALRQELALAHGAHPDFDRALEALERRLKATPDVLEAQARWLTQRLAQCLQAALLLRHAPAAIGETFCAARLGEETSPLFGVLPSHAPLDAILERIET
ncbi:acyl-CoA dehydrogenase family protein [Chromohalobacter japonicus]|uniref:acyl-CoA dehydrogenase family protein n=1 Tax=Chromohalobacter japonicus TaxID=223900 RepID=UPI00058F0E18|nr:acyl-CoA dehydrogenase family protein [Chromohalobacter japonicus]MCK0754081.1 acyl-CoA dehydrogenase family protein [Chromohalobacter japonicus]